MKLRRLEPLLRRSTSLPHGRRRTRAAGRKRFVDYPRHGRRGWRRWTPSWRQWLSALLLSAAGAAGLFAVVYASVDIPDENAAASREGTVYYWADGSQMVSVGAVNRQNVTLQQVPDSVEHAVIAAENTGFYSDSGVSFKGAARAVVNMLSGEEIQGGSTITQQYVKNTYLSQEQTLKRKLKEFCISLKLDNSKSKREILQGYLNTSWFGRSSYGIEAAARAYYGTSVKNLNPSQGALLAALLKGAEEYDPGLGESNHEHAEARWKWILDRQVATGLMSKAERARYRDFPEPRKLSKPTSQAGQTGYLIDVANKYIKQRTELTDKDLARGGYRIHTTFEKDKVRELERAVKRERERSIDPKKRRSDTHVEVGGASVRYTDGAIVAVYGGADATEHFSNNADTSGVPVGSAFKPFVMAAVLNNSGALYDNGAAPYDVVGPRAVQRPELDLFKPLVTSAHVPFVTAAEKVGLDRVRETAVASGLRRESMAPLEPTFALGTSTPSTIRMAGAYSTFVNGGTRTDPYSVTKVFRDGRRIGGFVRPPAARVMAPAVAEEVSGALSAVAWDSIDPETARKLGYVTAGRTGPNDRMKSAWFVGHTGEMTTAVTMFRSKPGTPQLLPMQGVGGPDSERGNVFPVRIWTAYATSTLGS
ncbi:transglycosylase domain-containing protein [Streptomyces sp. NPDC004647]|uniref:transglycosylase domain-containing protein n=1 Tax=Streptomyces sp. NPDC004647 TaxID=3154671 RepID=UPI0033A437E3